MDKQRWRESSSRFAGKPEERDAWASACQAFGYTNHKAPWGIGVSAADVWVGKPHSAGDTRYGLRTNEYQMLAPMVANVRTH